ncbi:hypothetical protein TNCV_4241801 [Trichonephila clavipes]|nr:hypothetical protein TNCV_4241801 [Trichonephila clavipes]
MNLGVIWRTLKTACNPDFSRERDRADPRAAVNHENTPETPGINHNLGGRTGKILRPSSVALKSKNQEINRLQLAVKLPWAIFFESVDILS